MDKHMDKSKESKRKDDDRAREPGRHPQAPEPERRYPDSTRPDTLRPGPGEGERKEGTHQRDDRRVVSAEWDDEDSDNVDIDDKAMPAPPVK